MAGGMGTLKLEPPRPPPALVPPPVEKALAVWPDEAPVDVDQVLVAPIDPDLADTAAFCEAYQVGLDISATCVTVTGPPPRAPQYAACIILATTRAYLNGVVRRHLYGRKCSFAP